jgi:hypothetical protein
MWEELVRSSTELQMHIQAISGHLSYPTMPGQELTATKRTNPLTKMENYFNTRENVRHQYTAGLIKDAAISLLKSFDL